MPLVGSLNPFLRTSALHTVAVIPARFASSRLPGKPLAEIAGRPMIEHVYQRVAGAAGIDAVLVATDDERIVAAVERFGGVARLTRTDHRTGTDRIAEIAADLSCNLLVNVQGDLPLIEAGMIEDLLAPLLQDETVQMSTLCQPIRVTSDITSPHVVKVVVDRRGNALYFSRSPIPFTQDSPVTYLGTRDSGLEARDSRLRPATARRAEAHRAKAAELATREASTGIPGPGSRGPDPGPLSRTPMYKHIGLYGFRRDFLLTFASWPQTPLERAESLEQLRVLENGFSIRTVTTRFESIEVDTPDDLERVRQVLTARV